MDFNVNQQQPVWRALFHPTRRQIVRLLQEKERTTGELSKFFDVTRYAVMKHLRVLEQADLIEVRREGRLRWNVLNQVRLQDIPADYLDKIRAGKGDQETEVDLIAIDTDVVSLDYRVNLPVPAAKTYDAFLNHVHSWWPSRTDSDEAIVLEPFIGGRFYLSQDGDKAGVLFGFITCLRPNEEIRILGPMDADNLTATSTVHIRFKDHNDSTEIQLTHRTVGEVNESMVSVYSSHWQERLDKNLRAFVTDRNNNDEGKG